MLTWTIDNFPKKSRRRKITVNLEGTLTSRDCAGMSNVFFDNYNRCAHLVLDVAQVEEKDTSMPVLICCLRRTTGLAAERVSLRGIPPRAPGATVDFSGFPEEPPCAFHGDCKLSWLGRGAPPVET